LTNRRDQIQQIVEDVLQESVKGGVLVGAELGGKDLFSDNNNNNNQTGGGGSIPHW
jgi:hypothetical protein